MNKTEHLNRQLRGKHFTRNEGEKPFDLAGAIEAASKAVSRRAHINGNGDVIIDSRQREFIGTNLTLNATASLPGLMDKDGQITKTPSAQPAGETVTLSTAAARNSRVVRAGATLIPIVGDVPVDTGHGFPALREVPNRFTVIEPALWSLITDTETEVEIEVPAETGSEDEGEDGVNEGGGTTTVTMETVTETTPGEVSPSALPFTSVDLDRDNILKHAIRVELTRSTLRDLGRNTVAAHVLHGIALGIGRAVDKVLLNALASAEVDSFTVAAAAEMGLRFNELQAIVGTSGAGVSDPLGAGLLNVSGVPADTSPDCTDTYVGAWDRAAVWLDPEVDLLIERTRSGGVILTAWLGLQAALPAPQYFWKAGSV
jgi:hypothetical protein